MEEIGDGIFVFRKRLPVDSCSKFTSGDFQWLTAYENKDICDIEENSPLRKEILPTYFECINSMLENYRKFDEDNQIPIVKERNILMFRLSRYSEGGLFKSHIDSLSENGKVITTVIYLNDNYEGGVLKYKKHNVEHNPSIGDIVMHPAIYTHPHAGMTVTKGTKYICTIMCNLKGGKSYV